MIEYILIKNKVININNPRGTLITFLNPVSYLQAKKCIEVYSNFDYILADGWLLVVFLRIIGTKVKRYSFDMTSMAPIVFKKAVEFNQSVYFIGARNNEIIRFIEIINKHFKNLRIAGFRNGYFLDDEERINNLKTVANINPDIVIVGMGVPLQEKYLVDLQDSGWNGCGYTCGGFIHQTTKNLYYYPKWINKLHLRMPYRFYKEPAFRKRIPTYFKFIFVFLNDFLKFKYSIHGRK